MPNWTAVNSNFEADVRTSFTDQAALAHLGARLGAIAPGAVEILLPYDERLTQHHGYLHAGVVTTIADTACGYAAYTLAPSGSDVLSVEFKVNLLEPAQGSFFVARGWVLRRGKSLTVCQAAVDALAGDQKRVIVAVMLATIRVRAPR
jgi:uncharacterized protein (TIGR00369 family)